MSEGLATLLAAAIMGAFILVFIFVFDYVHSHYYLVKMAKRLYGRHWRHHIAMEQYYVVMEQSDEYLGRDPNEP
jgi:hypothetical protein